MNVGENLKALRVKHQLTQEDLGEHLYLTRQTISKWETGKSLPDLDNLVALARLYQVSLDELVGVKTIEQSPERPKSPEQKKEWMFMWSRSVKRTIGMVGLIFLMTYAFAWMKEVKMQQSLYADTTRVFGVKEIEYENPHPASGEGRGKVEVITLMNGEQLIQPTYEVLQEKGLLNRLVHHYSFQEAQIDDGLPLANDSLH